MIPDASALLQCGSIVPVADLMEVAKWASVQYPKGLGPLDPVLAKHFNTPMEKLDFSAIAIEELVESINQRGLAQIVVVGIETHICVLQTTLDLLASQIDVFVVADAVAARGALDHQIAIDRMQSEGAAIVTTEGVLFEWCRTATHPQFKMISELVRKG
ncbi:MAG: isochorismatase family protein [Pirellulaceae bacterium]